MFAHYLSMLISFANKNLWILTLDKGYIIPHVLKTLLFRIRCVLKALWRKCPLHRRAPVVWPCAPGIENRTPNWAPNRICPDMSSDGARAEREGLFSEVWQQKLVSCAPPTRKQHLLYIEKNRVWPQLWRKHRCNYCISSAEHRDIVCVCARAVHVWFERSSHKETDAQFTIGGGSILEGETYVFQFVEYKLNESLQIYVCEGYLLSFLSPSSLEWGVVQEIHLEIILSDFRSLD